MVEFGGLFSDSETRSLCVSVVKSVFFAGLLIGMPDPLSLANSSALRSKRGGGLE
jgi:hypothetical protein